MQYFGYQNQSDFSKNPCTLMKKKYHCIHYFSTILISIYKLNSKSSIKQD